MTPKIEVLVSSLHVLATTVI